MSSLIAAYTFNEAASNDFSGNKNHLVVSGATFGATTSNNGGFGLDAIFAGTQYISGAIPSLASIPAFSCFFNYYHTSNADYNISIVPNAYTIYISGSHTLQFKIYDSGATAHTLVSSTVLSTSTWYTIACIWDGTNIYIYINGALDCQATATFANMAAGTGTIYVGSSAMHGRLNMFELRNIALTTTTLAPLNASPGGMLISSSGHSFAIGDLIADSLVVSQGVVTWINDGVSYYAYPFTGFSIDDYSKYGNVYNTLRQNIFEFTNDFDGNGNGQISIKYPIASFSDYNSPVNTITFDYRGLSGSPDSIQNMMAITSLRI